MIVLLLAGNLLQKCFVLPVAQHFFCLPNSPRKQLNMSEKPVMFILQRGLRFSSQYSTTSKKNQRNIFGFEHKTFAHESIIYTTMQRASQLGKIKTQNRIFELGPTKWANFNLYKRILRTCFHKVTKLYYNKNLIIIYV